MEAPAAGEAELEGSERLVARIFELIDAFYSNDGLWTGNKVHGDLLFNNSVARTKGRGTTVSTIGKACQEQRSVKSAARLQNATIVAREGDSRKSIVVKMRRKTGMKQGFITERTERKGRRCLALTMSV